MEREAYWNLVVLYCIVYDLKKYFFFVRTTDSTRKRIHGVEICGMFFCYHGIYRWGMCTYGVMQFCHRWLAINTTGCSRMPKSTVVIL